MPEQFFRYVPTARAGAWERAGWKVISVPLSMRPPLILSPEPVEGSKDGLDHANGNPIDVVIVEWQQPGPPVEPDQGHDPNAQHGRAGGREESDAGQ